MNKVLLTGAAGFIGSRTTQLLLDKNISVVGVDNMNDYYDVQLKRYRLTQTQPNPSFEFHELDIESQDALDALFRKHKFDAVINLAARAGVRYSTENPHVYLSTNAEGTLNLLECMRAHNVPKMVLASTSSLYAGQSMPFTETLPVNTPISPYAATKKAAEVTAYSYHYLFDLDISVVRYFTVYGPCGRPDMSVFRFIKWIDEGTPITLYGDGEQNRDFTFVDDIAKGTIAATKPLGYEIINLGGGNNPISMNYVIGEIEKRLGKKAVIDEKPFNKADLTSTWADISKADKLLGWKPEVAFSDGLEQTIQWYEANRSWLKNVEV